MKEETHYRLLPMNGAYNMRDLGGYRNSYGKHVKWKTILRSDDMKMLTTEDINYLDLLPLRTVIDFRCEDEKESAPDRLPQTVSKYIQLPINAGDMNDITQIDRENPVAMMRKIYIHLIRNAQDTYRDFFRIISEKGDAPLLFHCSAGKDRTGVAAALLLSALGAERATIVEDYMLSANYITRKYEFIIKAQPELEPLITVKEEYLDSAFRIIDEEYQGMENYLANNLGVDVEKLRNLYTE